MQFKRRTRSQVLVLTLELSPRPLSAHVFRRFVRALPPPSVVPVLSMVSMVRVRRVCRLCGKTWSVRIRVIVLGVGLRIHICSNTRGEAIDVAGAPVFVDSETVASKAVAYVGIVQDAFEAHGAHLLVVVSWEYRTRNTGHC